jgi:hypothetical protein
MKSGEDRRQHFATDDVARRHPHGAAIGGGFSRRYASQSRRGSRHRLDMRLDRQRRRSRGQTARRTGEQRQSQRGFQRIDVAPDGRLGQSKPARGSRQAAVARDLDEGA